MASPLEEVREFVAELESQCAQLAPAVDARDWHALSGLITDMGRSRHALTNAWEAAEESRTPEFDLEISERVARVVEYRAWYLDRLIEYNGGVSERLNLISRWKAYAKSVAGKRRQNPSLFSDIR